MASLVQKPALGNHYASLLESEFLGEWISAILGTVGQLELSEFDRPSYDKSHHYRQENLLPMSTYVAVLKSYVI